MILWEQGQEGGKTRPINRDNLYKNLCVLTDVLTKYGIKWWLTHGTMLGAYRENNFIEYDDDADIGADIATSGHRLEAEQELRDLGFFVPPLGDRGKPVDPLSNMPYSDTVGIKDGEKIEIWWYEKRGDKYLYDVYRQPVCLIHDARYYDTLSTMDFRGRKFNIPNHIEEWLVMMYGEDWSIPQRGRKYNSQ